MKHENPHLHTCKGHLHWKWNWHCVLSKKITQRGIRTRAVSFTSFGGHKNCIALGKVKDILHWHNIRISCISFPTIPFGSVNPKSRIFFPTISFGSVNPESRMLHSFLRFRSGVSTRSLVFFLRFRSGASTRSLVSFYDSVREYQPGVSYFSYNSIREKWPFLELKF